MYVILAGVPFCTVHNINDRFLFETETLKSLLSALNCRVLWNIFGALFSIYTTKSLFRSVRRFDSIYLLFNNAQTAILVLGNHEKNLCIEVIFVGYLG